MRKPSSSETVPAAPGLAARLQGVAARPARALLLLAALGGIAFVNGFSAPWVFDGTLISENTAIRQLWPPRALLSGSNRPVGLYSFALDYALYGEALWGYHTTNLAIHIAAAFTLYGLVRRTLRNPRMAEDFRRHADSLALAAALLWLVHPLQTQSVTYLYQRFESLMGLFYLLTLYLFLRAAEAERPWNYLLYAGSMLACLLGMGTKEVMITAPLLVLWYDRVLLSNSWKSLVRRHGAYYLVLLAILGSLAAFVLGSRAAYASSGVLVFDEITPWQYALSQTGVILHYLRLCFWPSGQCLDYAWPVAQSPLDVLPQLSIMLLLLAGTLWLIIRQPAWGFLPGAFFLILAPTSSVLPITDLAYEHRMYLPLAAVAVGAVLLGYRAIDAWQGRRGRARRAPGAAFLLALTGVLAALTVTTILRNRVYRSDVALWHDTARKAPHGERPAFNLACELEDAGQVDRAIAWYRRALELDPGMADARLNLAKALAGREPEAAIRLYQQVLERQPDNAEVHASYAALLAQRGELQTAVSHCRRALELDAGNVVAHVHLANILAAADPQAARRHAEAALEQDAGNAAAHLAMGNVLSRSEPARAAHHYRQAIEADPQSAEAHYNLANLLVAAGRLQPAVAHLRAALELRPGWAAAEQNLRILLEARRRSSRGGRPGQPSRPGP
jgi:tetratricopeptide (TPR) repeat protein